MKDPVIEIVVDPVNEARRYVENAKTILSEKGRFDAEIGCYGDSKYVKAAGHYLWSAVLLILDAVFEVKSQGQLHPDIKNYYTEIAKRDKKLLTMVSAEYNTAHITMGYDGNLSKATCMDGIRLANDIINRCDTMLKLIHP